MASERAMVAGFCGSISELPVFTAVEIGEHPVACAPKNFTGFGSTSPSWINSSNAFLIFVINDLRAQAVDLIVAAGDADKLCAKDLRAENLRGLEIGRNKDPRLESVAGGLC